MAPLLIVFAGFLAYENVFWLRDSGDFPFIFDDTIGITANESIRHVGSALANNFKQRPVLYFTLAVNYAFGELDPWPYRLVNVLIHILAALALYGIVRRTLMLPRYRERFERPAPYLALVCSLIWLVHPLQTSAVTYVIQRTESLMGMFYLVTLYCFLRGATAEGRWKYVWCAATLAACALGMGTKEVMITAPLIVLLYDRVFLSASLRQLLGTRGWLHAGLAATIVLLIGPLMLAFTFPKGQPATASAAGQTIVSTQVASARPSAGFGMPNLTPKQYALTQSTVIFHYLGLAIWPYPLCLDYGPAPPDDQLPYPSDWPVRKTWSEVLFFLIVLGIFLAGIIWALFRKPWLGFLGVWFFLILAPSSSIMPINDLIFEHRMYLSLAGLVVLVVVGGHALLGEVKELQQPFLPYLELGLAGFILILLTGLTLARNENYRTDESIWRDTVLKAPANFRAHQNLGAVLAKRGNLHEAEKSLMIAVELRPTDPVSQQGLGKVFHQEGRYAEAYQHLSTAVLLEPNDPSALGQLGVVCFILHKLEEAENYLQKSLMRKPEIKTYFLLGTVQAARKKYPEAIKNLSRVLEHDPNDAQALEAIGITYRRSGQPVEAVKYLTAAQKLLPGSSNVRRHLGHAHEQLGHLMEAATCYKESLRLNPHSAEDYFWLAGILKKLGLKEAEGCLKEGLRINPDWPQVSDKAARHLAADKDPLERGGPLAVMLARRVCLATGCKDPRYLDTLAAAYAETGNFQKAMLIARKAIDLAAASNHTDLKAQIEERLRLYENGQPLRE